ncbi:unnamed protein product [Cylindrotheca closterium]|uniref:Uncharacterized protein n=1 Tax=Cylindrotheca closterium TaxID=2856 RepID=A0AAD2GCX3_9STRA|nr:unnamed protein product [Cylindrotheca closterium]
MSGRFQNTGRGCNGRNAGQNRLQQGQGNGQYNGDKSGNGSQKEKKFHPLTRGNIPKFNFDEVKKTLVIKMSTMKMDHIDDTILTRACEFPTNKTSQTTIKMMELSVRNNKLERVCGSKDHVAPQCADKLKQREQWKTLDKDRDYSNKNGCGNRQTMQHDGNATRDDNESGDSNTQWNYGPQGIMFFQTILVSTWTVNLLFICKPMNMALKKEVYKEFMEDSIMPLMWREENFIKKELMRYLILFVSLVHELATTSTACRIWYKMDLMYLWTQRERTASL